MRAALTHPASKLFQNKPQVGCFCMLCSCSKRIIFKTNFLFWIFLVVVHGFIYSHEREQIQDTKYQAFYERGKVWNFLRGKRCSVLMVNAGKWCAKIKWWRCQYTFMCCQPFLSNFQWFQSCVSWTPFCISSCCVSHAIVSRPYPSVVVS